MKYRNLLDPEGVWDLESATEEISDMTDEERRRFVFDLTLELKDIRTNLLRIIHDLEDVFLFRESKFATDIIDCLHGAKNKTFDAVVSLMDVKYNWKKDELDKINKRGQR